MHDALRQPLFSTYDYRDNRDAIFYYHPILVVTIIYSSFGGL